MIDRFVTYLNTEKGYSRHTVMAYEGDLKAFAAWITSDKPAQFDPATVTMQDIRAWLGVMARKGLAPRSLRRKLLSIRSFYRFMRHHGLVNANPAADVELPKLPRPLPEFVPQDEMESVVGMEAFDTADWEEYRDKLIVDILYSTGIRRSELLAIADHDISTERGEIKVHGKGGKDRIVPIPPQLCDRISRYRVLRQNRWGNTAGVFLISHRGKPLNNDALSRIVKIELAATSTGRKTPHTLRHSCATALLKEGAEINSVKELLGHSSLATTQIYTHLSFSELKKNYESAHPRAKKRMNHGS